VNIDSIQITNNTELRKGMSGSSSIFASVIQAFSEYYNLKLAKKDISDIAYRGDIIAHGGTPSGIDNNTVVFGGYVRFRKSTGVKQLNVRNKYHIVIGDTLKPASTAEMVTLVRGKVEANDKAVLSALSNIDSISQEATDILKLGDLKTLGKLMDNNHDHLKILGVSSPELENLISAAKRAGALGAKLSGGGGGGCMVALCEDALDQKKVADAIKAAGGEAFITEIGSEGVRVETI
jgi:mevalonate kinase